MHFDGFPSSEQAGQCVSDVIGAGIIPGGMEIMDGPTIQAAEDSSMPAIRWIAKRC